MRVQLGIIVGIITGSVVMVAFAITLMFGMTITQEFYSAFDPSSIGGFHADELDHAIGNGWNVMALTVLAIPGSLALAVLVGRIRSGDGETSRPRRSGGPPF